MLQESTLSPSNFEKNPFMNIDLNVVRLHTFHKICISATDSCLVQRQSSFIINSNKKIARQPIIRDTQIFSLKKSQNQIKKSLVIVRPRPANRAHTHQVTIPMEVYSLIKH